MTNTHILPVHLRFKFDKEIMRILNDQKLMVRSKYEKYEILLAWPHVEGTNKLSISHECKKQRSVYPLEKINEEKE